MTLTDIFKIRAAALSTDGVATRIDRRKVSRETIRHAIDCGIVYEWDGAFWVVNGGGWQQYPTWTNRKGWLRSKTIELDKPFSHWRMIPDEVRWELVREMMGGENVKGRSIAKSPLWWAFDIRPDGDKYHTDTDAEQMIDVLYDMPRYLSFQFGGSIWEVSVRPEYRTCGGSR